VLSPSQLIALQQLVRATPIADALARWCVQLVRATRSLADGGHAQIAPLLRWGAGPRAGQALILAAKARATLHGRSAVLMEDLRILAPPVLRHRLQPGYEAEASGLNADAIIDRLLAAVPLPAAALESDPAYKAAIGG